MASETKAEVVDAKERYAPRRESVSEATPPKQCQWVDLIGWQPLAVYANRNITKSGFAVAAVFHKFVDLHTFIQNELVTPAGEKMNRGMAHWEFMRPEWENGMGGLNDDAIKLLCQWDSVDSEDEDHAAGSPCGFYSSIMGYFDSLRDPDAE